MAKSPKALAAKAAKPASVSELASTAPNEGATVHTFGGLSVIVTPVTSVPPGGQRSSKIPPLPFADIFTAIGGSGKFYVPDSFWTDRQKAGHIKADTKLTPAYIKGKVRAVFDKWKADAAHPERAKLAVTVYSRPTGISPSDDPTFETDPRAGHHVYLYPVAPPAE